MNIHLTEEQIQIYLDNEDNFEKIYIEEHLKSCASCQNNLEGYHGLYSALKKDPFPDLPKDFTAKVISAISDPEESRWQLFESGFTIAFFLFGIAASLYFFNPLPYLTNVAGNILNNFGEYASKFLPEFNGSMPIFIVAILIFLLIEIIDKKIVRPRL